MLVSFTARNFRSFKDEVTLDLRAPRGQAAGAQPWDGNVQAVAGIYGANASGKSNICQAIWTMASQVRDSYRLSRVTGDPFAFDAESLDMPTELSAVFVASDGVCYAYGFGVMDGRVVGEWAEIYRTARSTLLFERTGRSVKFGTALKGPNRAVERTVDDANLYLSAAAAAGHEGLAPIYDWIMNQLHPYPAHGHESILDGVVAALATEPAREERIAALLKNADLGVDGLSWELHEFTEAEKTQMRRVSELFRAIAGSEAPDDLPDETYRAFGTHVSDGKTYRLPIEDESYGTRAMLCYAFVIDQALGSGETVVFDELDRSLHPLLMRELVRTFQDRRMNPRQAQLIFTAHDVSLLEAGYGGGAQLDRNEVWVTERDERGVSTLTALADRSVKSRDNLARRYLSGRFGGIPQPVALVDPALT